MKEFFYNSFIEPFKEGLEGIILGSIIWIFSIIASFFVSWGIFYVIDSVGLEDKTGTGVVVARHYYPAHTTTTFVTTGKTMIPVTNYVSEDYSLCVKIGDQFDFVSVYEFSFNLINDGDSVECVYNEGRISGDVYINQLKIK